MSEASASAMLVGTPEMLDERPGAVTTTLSRSEIEEALSVDPPADLVLQILRARDGGAEAEKRTLRVEWDRADLESVLVSPETQAIRFSFAPSEIETALDGPDVEGHGLREKAVVLSIAATAAVAGTSAAYAQPDPGSGSRGDSAQVVVAHDEQTFAARGIEAGSVASSHDEATFAERGIQPGPVAAVHDEATFTARGIETGSPPVSSDTGSGFEFPTVDAPTAVGVAGALAGAGLLIAAAAFATRRREPGTV